MGCGTFLGIRRLRALLSAKRDLVRLKEAEKGLEETAAVD
jgi:hypothetical protein